jgi:hypothetical protein
VAQTGNTVRRLSWAACYRSSSIDPSEPGAGSPATSAFQPQSTDPRQLERRDSGIEADIEPQDVQLEPLIDDEEEARKP